MAVGGSLGSSSPSFLGTHLPGTPDLGGPFPVASLWDGRCFVLNPACISGLPLWSSGSDVSGKGCTFRCLICLLVLLYCHHTSSLAFVCLVNSACLHTLSFVTYFGQSQTHAQPHNIIGH